ncbi:MAG: glycosyltransferase family 2 protein [Patescibacteria group bacterium]
MKKIDLTIFFPYLNDWGTVGSMILLSASTAKKLKKSFEILAIDDGSNNMSKDALDSMKRLVPNLRIIHHNKNTGYGGALRSGFRRSRGKLIFYTDGDAQYDVRELSKLFAVYKPGIGLVNGYKKVRHDPWYRTVLGGIYHHTVKIMFGLKIRDTDCDFRLIEKRVFDKVKLFESSGTICVELVKKISHFGYKIKEVPVSHYDRPSGFSQFFNLPRLYRTGTGIIKLWWKLIIKQEYLA